ncbi:MAG TPA: ATP-binding cassette domain-containing protein [bacterium]|jgi:cell division transport system ATP-binding protein
MDDQSPVIDLVNVFTGFDERAVLQGVTLKVTKGEAVIIEGATGAGKTTLIRLLLGALPVRSGYAHVLNTDLARAAKDDLTALRRKIGVVFQIPRFLDQETVLTNVSLPLAIAGERARRCRTDGARALLDTALHNSARKRPAQLSGGEQARLQIARALIHRPYLLLADEPFAHLDPDSAEAAEDLLETAHRRGATLVITTHRPTRLAEHARRVRLEGGILV